LPRFSPLRLAHLLLVCLWAVCVYKAATVAISADEAYTYNRSVSQPIPRLWDTFDANDHVLHTLLCKVAVGLVGVSEFTLRLPALAAGWLLLTMLRRLSFLWFGNTWAALLTFAAIAVNPFLLDYASMARGYGMALALWLTAWDQLLRHHAKPHTRWRLWMAGIALALAVAANLTFVLPGIALIAAFCIVHIGGPLRRKEYSRARARLDWLLDHLIVPGFVLAVAILTIPLLPMQRKDFYVGSDSLRDSAINFFYAQLWRPKNLLEGSPWHFQGEAVVINSALPALLIILAGGILACLWWRKEDRWRFLGLTALLTVLLLAVFSYGLGMPFPYRRTGLYLVPLLGWLAAAALTRIPKLAAAVALLWIAWLGANWDLRYYDEWLMDAGNRDVMRYVRSLQPADSRKLTAGSTFPLEHSLRFYQTLWHLDWLTIPKANKTADGNFDIHVIGEEELPVIAKRNLQVRYTHPLSQVRVAINPQPNSSPAATDPSK